MLNWTLYTDGGCHGNPGPCAWGCVAINSNGVIEEGSGFLGHGTNQIAELSAGLNGLLMTPRGADVTLISDSQYLLKGISEWRAGWEAKGFRNSKKEIIANLELWKEIFAAVDERKVKVKWVKGHSGDTHNERCDVLATNAILQNK